MSLHIRGGNRTGRVGLGWAGPTVGWAKNRAEPKLARFFRAKVLTAQPALKTGPIGPNSIFKAKKIRAGRAGPGHIGLGHTGPGQIWPGFFRAKVLTAQPALKTGPVGLAHWVGPILPRLLHITSQIQSFSLVFFLFLFLQAFSLTNLQKHKLEFFFILFYLSLKESQQFLFPCLIFVLLLLLLILRTSQVQE